MSRSWRDSQLAELRLRMSELLGRRDRLVHDMDLLVDEQSQLREQVGAYEEQLKSVISAPVCSLQEYKSTARDIERSKTWIANNNEKLDEIEGTLSELKQHIESTRIAMLAIERDIASYGKVLEFRQ